MASHKRPPNELVLNFDPPDDRVHVKQKGLVDVSVEVFDRAVAASLPLR